MELEVLKGKVMVEVMDDDGKRKIKRTVEIKTIAQVAEESGMKYADINMKAMTYKVNRGGTALDVCYPFKTADKPGFKFIACNHKWEELMESVKPVKKKK